MVCGWSEMVNFMAVTTVVLMRADGDDSAIFSLGSRLTEWRKALLTMSVLSPFSYVSTSILHGIKPVASSQIPKDTPPEAGDKQSPIQVCLFVA